MAERAEKTGKRRGPLEPKLGKEARKLLAGRLRRLLAVEPMDMGEMARALAVEPEAVVVALRELRTRKKGRLLSTIRLGHVCWWWETPPPEPAVADGKAEQAPEKVPKKKEKGR